jgi:hypothetical protein
MPALLSSCRFVDEFLESRLPAADRLLGRTADFHLN